MPWQEHGDGTLECYAGAGVWLLTREYGAEWFYVCDSDWSTPPLTGWEVCKGVGAHPPPALQPTTRPAEDIVKPAASSQVTTVAETPAIPTIRHMRTHVEQARTFGPPTVGVPHRGRQ